MRRFIDIITEGERPQFLYHGTWGGNVKAILRDGLTAPSYWGTHEVAASYMMQYDGGIMIRVPINSFDEEYLEVNEHLFSSLSDDDPETETPTTWEDSLEACGSVVYHATLEIDPDDIIS